VKAVTTRLHAVVSRRLEPATSARGHYWVLKLDCGHEVTRFDTQGGGTQERATCWRCPPKHRRDREPVQERKPYAE
jgi:hypothetical protein